MTPAARLSTAWQRSTVGVALSALSLRATGRRVSLAVGFSPWKEDFTRKLFRDDTILFVGGPRRYRLARRLLAGAVGHLVIWSLKDQGSGYRPNDFAGIETLRLEDGFVRSLGRGLDHTPPWSLCLDATGLYFDASRPSDLETMCETLADADHAAVAPAVERTIDRLRQLAISKYNLGLGRKLRPAPAHVNGSVLVLGQVEDDNSILRNTNAISTNRDLILRAIADRPGARIFFKQHPDCLGRPRRRGHVDLASLPEVEEIDPAVGIADAIAAADTVYTISSLGGFEALLRGKEVVTFGAPFYAGWGLTRDHVDFSRRRRRLTVQQLFYVAFIRYPVYFDPNDGRRLTLDDVIDRFSQDLHGVG